MAINPGNAYRVLKIITLVLLCFNGISAIIGGGFLIADPLGTKMGLTVNLLRHSAFHNFLVPGILLMLFNGVLSLVALVFTVFNYSKAHWLIIGQGAISFAWIIAELLIIKDLSPMHLIFGAIAVVLLICGMMMRAKSIKQVF